MADIYLKAPLAGVRREAGFQEQAPYSTLESINFWPRDAVTGRSVSATRPPIVPVSSPGTNINLLAEVNRGTAGAIQQTMVAASGGTLSYWNGSAWATPSGSGTVTTGRPVFTASYIQQCVILNDTTPLVYDASNDSIATFSATSGTFPNDARIGATWQGGIWVAGQISSPHIFYGSATGDIEDWDFSATTSSAAFAATGTNEGLIGGAVTALAPQTGDVMVIGTENTLWALRGHPSRGGVLDLLSDTIGILGQGAWTKGPDGTLFFLSKAGVMTLSPNPGAVPTPLSPRAIPDELVGLPFNPLIPTISMEYDSRWGGIHIMVRGDEEQAWFYDVELGGFHQMSLLGIPTVMLRFDAFTTEATNGLLYGGSAYNGLAQMDTTGKEQMSYSMAVGPVKLTPNVTQQARVNKIHHLFTGNTKASTGVTQVVTRTGVTAEDVIQRRENDDGTTKHVTNVPTVIANGGISHVLSRGHALMLDIGGSGDGTCIVYEGSVVSAESGGKSTMLAGQSMSVEDTTTSINTSFYRLYATATPQVSPAETLTDFSAFVDLSRLDSDWWDVVRQDGGDIRPTTATNTFLSFDLVEFSKSDRTGMLVIKSTIPTTPTAIRIWAGNPLNTLPAVDQALGQYNAYDSNVLGFWPDAATTDRTQNQLHLVPYERDVSTAPLAQDTTGTDIVPASPTAGDGDGLIGAKSTLYGSATASDIGTIRHVFAGEIFSDQDADPPTFTETATSRYTLSAFVRQETALFDSGEPTGGLLGVLAYDAASTADYAAEGHGIGLKTHASATTPTPSAGASSFFVDNTDSENCAITASDGSSADNEHQTNITLDTWYHVGSVSATSSGANDHSLFLDTTASTDTPTNGSVVNDASHIFVSGLVFTDSPTGGHKNIHVDICMAQVDATPRSSTWVTYRSRMSNQTTFWGTWTTTIVNA